MKIIGISHTWHPLSEPPCPLVNWRFSSYREITLVLNLVPFSGTSTCDADARAAPLCYAERTSPPWQVRGSGASGTPEPKFLVRREMETEAGEGVSPA